MRTNTTGCSISSSAHCALSSMQHSMTISDRKISNQSLTTRTASDSDWFYSVQGALRSGKQPGRCSLVNVQLGSSESFHWTLHYDHHHNHHQSSLSSSDFTMNIDDEEDDNKDSGFYCLGCDDIKLELDCIKEQQGCLPNPSKYQAAWAWHVQLVGLTVLYLRPAAGRRAGQHTAGEKQRPGVHRQTSAGSHRGPDTGDRGRQ